MRFHVVSFIAIMFCAACSTAPDQHARQQAVTVLPGTYAVSAIDSVPNNDPTCAKNYSDIVGHLEQLMAQKNSGTAAVQSR